MKKILVLDNYDSFTFNLVHYLKLLVDAEHVHVVRNDKIHIDNVQAYDKIILSPGPGIPSEAGIMKETIQHYASTKSILGVCLGHQGIAEVFGSTIYNMKEVLHGVQKPTHLAGQHYIFEGIPRSFMTARYHSWSVEKASLNGSLRIIALDDEGVIMGLAHVDFDVVGLQFHPESIITEHGFKILSNWVKH